jgi:hypothetical protein
MPSLPFNSFRDEFNQLVTELGITWELVGFYSPDGRIYPFGTDTKVISTVFEALAAPLIKIIAEKYNYVVEGAEQTVYPDFTLSSADEGKERIAIDIKTTYRRFNNQGQVLPFRYTLGSYTSFLRSPGATKNILYPYSQYSDHWTIGFLYTRRIGVASKVYYQPAEASELLCPYHAVEYFIQEKHRIVGLSPASGNTTNIGSFPTNDINELRAGNGPFAAHGKVVCDDYWRHFPRTTSDREYRDVAGFIEWFESRRLQRE